MSSVARFRWLVLFSCLVPRVAGAAVAEPMLFRLFLADGTSVVSYGEFARVDDQVVFSLMAGGGNDRRLQVATLPASQIDWPRTERHAASTRYQWYAKTRGEEDFEHLSQEVAEVLNRVVQEQNPVRALEVARQARATLAEWPRTHFGYRQKDVREVLGFLDEVVSNLRASAGETSFDLAMVASTPDVELEPLVLAPSSRDQVEQLLRTASLTDRAAERVALLQVALEVLRDAGPAILPGDVAPLRRLAESRLRLEEDVDARYSDLSRRLLNDASRGASRANVTDVQKVLNRLPREDARLGGRRPETVQALRSTIQAQLDAAQRLRLLRDRWAIRRPLYRNYERSVRAQLAALEKSQTALNAIKRLDGPDPGTLANLRARLSGGASLVERIPAPEDLRQTHELLVGAWRFAEAAVSTRYAAVRDGNLSSARQASSAAGSALLLLARVQAEIQEMLEPPRLQ